jgi:hypothetical protein
MLTAVGICAQQHFDGNKMLEQIKAKKVEFMRQKLDLNPAEEKAFWPIYNEYEQKRWEINKNMRDKMRQMKKGSMENPNYLITDRMINEDVAKAQLAKIYYEKFKKVLSPEKLLRYYLADKEFKEIILGDIKRKAQLMKSR